MIFKKLVMLSVFLFSFSVKAGFLLDPYLGYSVGENNQTLSNVGVLNGDYKYSNNGIRYGSRVGIEYLGIMGGIDYGMGTTKRKLETAPPFVTAAEHEYKIKQIGAFIGYNLPFLLRAWGTYYFSYDWEVDGGAGEKLSGSAFALGVGFTGLPLVSINLEYKSFTFDESRDESTGVITKYPTSQRSEIEGSEVMLSVSIPLNF